ncbi:MAG: hypothetical protein H0T73_15625 [Ardenticatenales bacterium]|nr:hypothetical protein [Ardenticatenales bacterium]
MAPLTTLATIAALPFLLELFLGAFVQAYPEEAMRLIGSLKRKVRAWIAHRSGQRMAKEYAKASREQARNAGASPAEIDAHLKKVLPRLARSYGEAHARRILGPPTDKELFT